MSLTFRIAKTHAAGWLETVRICPDDLYSAVEEAGYMRIVTDETSLEIVELFAADPDSAVRAAAALAIAWGKATLDTWLPPTPWMRENLTARSRDKTRPMIYGTDSSLDEARFWGSDYF